MLRRARCHAALSAMLNRSSKISEKDEAKAGAEAGPAAAHALPEGGMAEAAIGGALVAVLQDFVGFADFLNFTSLVASLGSCPMPFHRKLAERRLQLGIVRVPTDRGFRSSSV